LLNYRLPAGLPSGSRAAWTRLILQPLGHTSLTPLSYSLLAEVTGRAWFQYYDRAGFDPMPRARVVRQLNGTAYFNLTMSAQREVEHAATTPITLNLNGSPFAVAKAEKAGFLASIKAGFGERRMEKVLATAAEQRATLVEKARAWHDRIRDYRWTQAEILQIMEEIEPTATLPFIGWLGSRQTLLLAINRLLRLSSKTPAESLSLLEQALGVIDGVTEIEIGKRLNALNAQLSPDLRARLLNGDVRDPAQASLPAGFTDQWKSLLGEYGHRALNMGELAEPRWNEDSAPLLRALASARTMPQAPDSASMDALLASIDARERKSAQAAISTVRAMLILQSGATDALAWIFAGARRWAAGAAREANADRRILALDDVFSFELEELKQMMTNEWNVSDSHIIQGKAETRKAQMKQWQATDAAELLIGDSPAEAMDPPHSSPLLDATRWIAPVHPS